MIDVVVRVIDRLIQLRQLRSDRLRKQYDLVVGPVVADLTAVHADYLRMFLDAKAQLVAKLQTPSETADMLEARRVTFEPVREMVMAQAGKLLQHPLPPLVDTFNSAVLAYLPVGDVGVGSGTAATTLIQQLHRISETYRRDYWPGILDLIPLSSVLGWDEIRGTLLVSEDPVECIDYFLEVQRSRWRSVCAAAAAVRAAVAATD